MINQPEDIVYVYVMTINLKNKWKNYKENFNDEDMKGLKDRI